MGKVIDGFSIPVTLPAGVTMTLNGLGVATTLPGNAQKGVNGSAVVGPYPSATTVSLSAIGGTLNYSLSNDKKKSTLVESNVLYEGLAGYLNVPVATGANPYSQMIQRVMPAEFDSVRIGVMNADNSVVAGVKVAVASGTTLGTGNTATSPLPTIASSLGFNTTNGSPLGALLTWRTATWGGAATGTLPATSVAATGIGLANGGGTECTITWTDAILCPSAPRDPTDGLGVMPVLYVDLVWPAGVNRTTMNMETFVGSGVAAGQGWEVEGNDLVAPYGYPIRVVTNPTQDMVATPGYNFVSGAVREYKEWPPIVVEFTLRNGMGKTLLVFGDSLHEGAEILDVIKCGWPAEMRRRVSTMTNPVAINIHAVGGTTMDDWVRRMNSVVSSYKRANVFVPRLSPNSLGGPISAVNISNARSAFGKCRALANVVGDSFITATCMPSNSTGSGAKNYGASWQTMVVPENNITRAGGFNYFDFDEVISTQPVMDANGQYYIKPGYQAASGIHLTRAGQSMNGLRAAQDWVTF